MEPNGVVFDKSKKIAEIVKYGSAEEVLNQKCPVCGDAIYAKYSRSIPLLFADGIIIQCNNRNCNYVFCLDGHFKKPIWVKSHGNIIGKK